MAKDKRWPFLAHWVARSENTEADALANWAVDAQRSVRVCLPVSLAEACALSAKKRAPRELWLQAEFDGACRHPAGSAWGLAGAGASVSMKLRADDPWIPIFHIARWLGHSTAPIAEATGALLAMNALALVVRECLAFSPRLGDRPIA